MFGEKRSRAFAFAKLLGPSNAIATEYIQPSLDTVTSSITSIQSSLDSVATVAANITGGSESYTSVANLPLSGNDVGSLAFVQETNRLYIWNGTGWFNIALINTNPTITQGSDAEYTLATDGTPTVITLEASDPEGVPIQWSYEVTSGSLTNGGGTTASITQSNNTFIITPSTSDAYSGLFELTFTASDGVNIDTTSSSFSLQFIAPPAGGVLYSTPGTYSWVCPAGVYSVSAICIGGGGGGGGAFLGAGDNYKTGHGGGGGGLGWKNNIPVVPGQSYTVVVGDRGLRGVSSEGSDGGDSYFISTATVMGGGGGRGRYLTRGVAGSYVGDGGGNGGYGGNSINNPYSSGGGGGAGGYSGNGGDGGYSGSSTTTDEAGYDGQGGGGGGGSGKYWSGGVVLYSGSGGGVGILGEGTSGAGADPGTSNTGGRAGSPGSQFTGSGSYGFGGGAYARGNETITNLYHWYGGYGAVRIIWGSNRAFPSTNVDLASSTDGETTI